MISFEGDKINIFNLDNEALDDDSLRDWALSLRNNYVEEHLLKQAISGTGLDKQEYLEKMIFPNPKIPQGAATMSGEFGELLIHDYINFVLNYDVPRIRYYNKENPNMPVPGSDVIGYKVKKRNKPSKSDQLLVAEVKTRSSVSGNKNRLCEKTVKAAIEHSIKDRVRIGESLNAQKVKLLTRGRIEEANVVERFQNKTDNPFTLDFFAVAVLDDELYLEQVILDVVNNLHENIGDTNLLIIYSKQLKSFLRDIYGRACSC